jgi:hypothetical protein
MFISRSALSVNVRVTVMQAVNVFLLDRLHIPKLHCQENGSGHVLAHHSGFEGLFGILADGENTVVLQNNRGRTVPGQHAHDLVSNLLAADQGETAAGNLTAELVGHRGQNAGNGSSIRGPGGGVRAVRVSDAANVWHVPVDVSVRGGVTRGLVAFLERRRLEHFGIEAAMDHVFARQIFKHHARSFDQHSFIHSSRNVATGPCDESTFWQLEVPFQQVFSGSGVFHVVLCSSIFGGLLSSLFSIAVLRMCFRRFMTSFAPRPK